MDKTQGVGPWRILKLSLMTDGMALLCTNLKGEVIIDEPFFFWKEGLWYCIIIC